MSVPLFVFASQVRDVVTGIPIAPLAGAVPTADGVGGATWLPGGGGTSLGTVDGSSGTSLVVNGGGPSFTVKGLVAGAGIAVTNNLTDVIITNTSPASLVTLDPVVGFTGTSIVVDNTGPSLTVKGLVAAAGTALTITTVGNDVVFTNTVVLSSAGGTSLVVAPGTGPAISIKGLTAGSGITLTPSVTDITIATDVTLNSAGGTETLVNDGVGPVLAVKGLTADTGSGIKLTSSATEVKSFAAAKLTQAITNGSSTWDDPNSQATLFLTGAGEIVGDGIYPANSTSAGTTIKIYSAFTGQGSDNVELQVEVRVNGVALLSIVAVGPEDFALLPASTSFTTEFVLQMRGANTLFCYGRVESDRAGVIYTRTGRTTGAVWNKAAINTISLFATSLNAETLSVFPDSAHVLTYHPPV